MDQLRIVIGFIILSAFPAESFAGRDELRTCIQLALGGGRESTRGPARRVSQMLKSLPKIRIALSNSSGMGHVAAGLAIVENLKDLGYAGTIEVVYHSKDGEVFGKIESKIRSLSPHYWKGTDPKLKWIDLSNGNELDETPLTLLGGVDSELRSFGNGIYLPGFFDKEGETASDRSMNLHTSIALVLQPFLWKNPVTVVSKESGRRVYPALVAERLRTRPTMTPSTLLTKIPENLQSALRERDRWKLGYLYGVHGFDVPKEAATVLAKWVEALFRRQALDPDPKPILLISVNPLEDLLKETPLKASIQKGLVIADTRSGVLPQVKARGVLVYSLGQVDRDVTEALMVESDLPVLIEGVNSLNQAAELAKPFLLTTGTSTDISKYFDAYLKGRTKLEPGMPRRYDFHSLDVGYLTIAEIEELLSDFENPNSLWSQRIREAAMNFRMSDRVVKGLNLVADEVLSQLPSKPPHP